MIGFPHRGARAHAPEDPLEALRRAVALGPDGPAEPGAPGDG